MLTACAYELPGEVEIDFGIEIITPERCEVVYIECVEMKNNWIKERKHCVTADGEDTVIGEESVEGNCQPQE
jgi:hypothetical protein